jgi:predicted nuclease with TOPRIM domain
LNTKPLEEAVMRGVRQALTEDVAEHALEVALRELQRRMDAAKERLRSLRVEREAKTRECEQARVSLPTLEELMPRVRAKLEQMESILTEDVARGRLPLGALLNGERLRVYADGRIEGNAILPENELAALGRESSGRQASVVAGACYARGLPVTLVLPVRGRVLLAA